MIEAEIQEILVEIEEKKKKADELATEFRRLYRESQEAYQDGDGELAKELSEEGHEAQNECQDLNKEIADLNDELRSLNEQKKKHLRVNALPIMAIEGIPPSFQQAITETLKSLPAHHISGKLIERVSYSDQYIVGSTGYPIQADTHFRQTEKAIIVINRQTRDGFINIADVKKATAHEVGHVVYRKIIDDEQRAEWLTVMNEIYAPLDDLDEDERANEDEFARAYAAYQLNDSDWQREFLEEYEYLNSLSI